MLFSILIPTIPSRRKCLGELVAHLRRQITEAHAEQQVEIITQEDAKVIVIGTKRNQMLQKAKGKFVAFVDDDDWVSPSYVADILHAIRSCPGLDCVGFYGEVFFVGQLGGVMIHSTLCRTWTEVPGYYYRPPNHLNPIRTELARRVRFRPVRFSEDHFWSLEMMQRNFLKTEVFLGHRPTYIYRCNTPKRGL